MENPWFGSSNKAGSVFNSFIPDGEFELNTGLEKGDLKLSQLSPKERAYSFNSHKTIRLDNIVFDGGVKYINQQEEEVGWTARMDPTTRNPYMLADSIYGLYSKDYVSLFGSFGYMLNENMVFGFGVDYLVGDGARIKDPRAVNNLFSLDIKPSFIYVFPGFKIGANIHLMKGREKISYSTIENSTTYRFFRMFGLGIGAKAINSWSYSRNYYSSGIGGGLQSEYKLGQANLFSGLDYFYSKEASEDGSNNPRKNDAGDYKESNIRFYTSLNLKKSLLHFASFHVNMSMGEGVEFIQEPYSEENITYYRTVAEVSKYSLLSVNPGIRYKLAKPYNQYLNKWELDLKLELDHLSSEYLLEARQSISNIIPSVKFDKSVFLNKNQIMFGLSGQFIYSLNNELKQLRPYMASQNIAAWQNIVHPDFILLSSTTYSAGAHFRYGRFVNIMKGKSNLLYVDLGMNFSFASNEEWVENLSWEQYRIKLGLSF